MRRALAVVVIAMSVATGCGIADGSDTQDPSPSEASPATPTDPADMPLKPPPVSYEDAASEIPLEGSDKSPAFWRVTRPTDPEIRHALEAAQKYLALYHYVQVQDRLSLAKLFSGVAIGRERREGYYWVVNNRIPEGHGPFWTWIGPSTPRGSNTVDVQACTDASWYKSDNETHVTLPRPEGDRASIRNLTLRQVKDFDGSEQWKVAEHSAQLDVDPSGTAFEQQCYRWANHKRR